MAQDRKQRGNLVDKQNKWLNSIVISGVAVIAFMVGALYGKQFNNLQWETLLAGTLGLIGGTFAWFSAQSQIKANKAQWEESIKRETELINSQFYEETVNTCGLILAIKKYFNPVTGDYNTYLMHDIKKVNQSFEIVEVPIAPTTIEKEIIDKYIPLRNTFKLFKVLLDKIVVEIPNDLTPVPKQVIQGIKINFENLEDSASTLRESCRQKIQD
jgi:predicted ribosomally synthesized peptide with SipW-like signal peptide